MKKSLLAAAFAAAILPAASFTADAAGMITTFGTRTYALSCAVNAQDGAALKVRIMVKNTSGRYIKTGTQIVLYVWTRSGARRYATTAYRDVGVNDSIGLDQPRGASACSAHVTLPRYDRRIITKRTQ
jgi:hypothetical protein